MNKNLIAALQARFEMAAKAMILEQGEIEVAQHALVVLFERYEDTVDAIENAIWMDRTEAEVGRPTVEGVDNDGLTEDEVNAAMDEQDRPRWPMDEFGREIDPDLNR